MAVQRQHGHRREREQAPVAQHVVPAKVARQPSRTALGRPRLGIHTKAITRKTAHTAAPTMNAPGGRSIFSVTVYVIISLVPLVCVSVLLFLSIIPALIRQRDFLLLYSVLGVVSLCFLLSLLGYFMTRQNVQAILNTIQNSRSKLDQLVKMSSAILGEPHGDIVRERIRVRRVPRCWSMPPDPTSWPRRRKAYM